MKQQKVIVENVPAIFDIIYKKHANRQVSFNAITVLNRKFQYTLEAPFDLQNENRKELFISNDALNVGSARKEALNVYLKFR